jgi:hypothetical protein
MIILLGRGIINQAQASQLRARLDGAVYRLVRMSQLKVSNHETFELETFIKRMHTALLGVMSLLKVDVLVNKHVSYTSKNVMATTLTDIKSIFNSLELYIEPKTPVFDRAVPGHTEAATRAQILKTFGSIVRNDEWMSLMLQLGAKDPATLNRLMIQAYSSGQGREMLADKKASLVVEITKGLPLDTSASGDAFSKVMSVVVGVTPKIAVMNVKVAPLFSALMMDPVNSEAVNRLLGEATRIEEVYVGDIPVFIQKKIDSLVEGLTLQKTVYDEETKAKRTAAVRKKEDAAVTALAGMREHLSVLAANPALMARALEMAGISSVTEKLKRGKKST